MTNNFSKIEDVLADDGIMLQKTVGISMRPMLISGRDQVVLSVPSRPLRVDDVVLYRRGKNYVLHRIIGIRSGELVIRGDNCIEIERGLVESDIIAILVGFYKGNRYIDCETSSGYKLYVKAWKIISPLWRVVLRLKILAINLIKKTKKRQK